MKKFSPIWYFIKQVISNKIKFNLDPDKWSPALQAPGYESIPVKIEVASINSEEEDAQEVLEVYNMFDYRPGLNIREEDYYVGK